MNTIVGGYFPWTEILFLIKSLKIFELARIVILFRIGI